MRFNGTKLLDGEYQATIQTEDGVKTRNFTVDAGIDPGRVGLGEVDDANVSVDVMGSQVSTNEVILEEPFFIHQLYPMSLDVVANGETKHTFENPSGDDNINTGPTWQDKTNSSYTYNFTIENETELTLGNRIYRYNTCGQSTDPDELPHYSDPEDRTLVWCDNIPSHPAFKTINASQGQNLQNVRVRSAENNTIPVLPTAADQQMTATETLEERGLMKDEDELDLGPGEFVFLFENTANCGYGCDDNDIDALWDQAISAPEDEPNDPDFNDLIVYVQVERAGVDPGTPSITIMPGGGDSTDVDTGDGSKTGDGPVEVDPSLEGDADEGAGPDIGTGTSDNDVTGGMTGDTGVDVDADHIVIG
ncbi:hypothetical protein Natpe_0328 [Natrinema pellirubrum DSM 15624]|uniref:Uncharacterized protein n=2 Tax=Natrinema pellirubrum (strain DSM 15624 / CIP 106293 / JCM 10476 / NCIMB 786 / 157) TaxID=797303 RepID=L0JFF3_NATP1|nr:hypothetical protein [Natrinema pellirubrum]AGB30260.1 hypothetical protein Natpe_0328 [Natrinema pellirubrum DSM 15624]